MSMSIFAFFLTGITLFFKWIDILSITPSDAKFNFLSNDMKKPNIKNEK